jgi:hypothetical protein
MNTNTRRFARYLALPVISAGIVGGAALGLAGTASAATNADIRPPHVAASPDVRAHPAPNVLPGAHWHRGIHKMPSRHGH